MTQSIGHNSVQIPHDGKYREQMWMAAGRYPLTETEKNNAFNSRYVNETNGERKMRQKKEMFNERNRLIANGTIKPAHLTQPQRLEKDENGRWCPQLEIIHV